MSLAHNVADCSISPASKAINRRLHEMRNSAMNYYAHARHAQMHLQYCQNGTSVFAKLTMDLTL